MGILFDNFEILADAPKGTQKLRELILQLAVAGNLVPQDPNDEPASVLLEKIKAEKERLIKDGKVRKQKLLPNISDSEKPYNLPDSWEWVRLNNVFDVRDGTHDTPKYVSKGVPLVTSKNISSGKLDFSNIKYISIEDHLHIKKRSHVEVNDILFAMIGSIGNPVIVDTKDEFSIKNVALIKYYCRQASSPSFLLNCLEVASEHMKAKATGGVQAFVSLNYLRNFLFPLPPLNEQKRIVAKVDKLMALCDELEEKKGKRYKKIISLNNASLDKLLTSQKPKEFQEHWQFMTNNFETIYNKPENVTKLKQAILQLAVMGKLVPRDPNDEPIERLLKRLKQQRLSLVINEKEKMIILEEFERLENMTNTSSIDRFEITARCICDFITKGTTPAKNELLIEGDIPFLKVYNIVDNTINFFYKPIYISRIIHSTKLQRSKVFAGDVLMNIVGPPLGKVAIVPSDFDEWNINQALAIFRPVESVNIKYMFYLLSCYSTLESVLKETRGMAGQDNLSLEQCRNLRLPICTQNEQKRIVAKVDQLMTLCDTLEESLKKTESKSEKLFNAVVNQLQVA